MTIDNFNRADGGLGPNWTNSPGFTAGTLGIVSNAVVATGAVWRMAYWNATAAPNDQYAAVVCTAGSYPGVLVRHQPGVSSFYFCFRNSAAGNGPWLYRCDNGAFTLLTNSLGNPINLGDTLRLQVTGSTLEVFVNGVSRGTFVDATYASGQPGIALQAATVDDFDAGPFGGATNAVLTLTGVGALTVSLAQLLNTTSVLTGTGALTAQIAQRLAAHPTQWSGAGALTSILAQELMASAALTGAGNLTADLAQLSPVATLWQALAALSGTGRMDVTLGQEMITASSFGEAGRLAAQLIAELQAVATLAGSGSLHATLQLGAAPLLASHNVNLIGQEASEPQIVGQTASAPLVIGRSLAPVQIIGTTPRILN